MQPYANAGGNSGISAYELGSDSITVRFKDGSVYRYTNASAGAAAISTMQDLAEGGQGLNAFINRYAKHSYAGKSR